MTAWHGESGYEHSLASILYLNRIPRMMPIKHHSWYVPARLAFVTTLILYLILFLGGACVIGGKVAFLIPSILLIVLVDRFFFRFYQNRRMRFCQSLINSPKGLQINRDMLINLIENPQPVILHFFSYDVDLDDQPNDCLVGVFRDEEDAMLMRLKFA